jgi:hypothetical protein
MNVSNKPCKSILFKNTVLALTSNTLWDSAAGDGGIKPGSCSNRKESVPLNSKAAILFLMNYFPTIPDQSGTCKDHSTSLIQMLNVCYHGAGKAPNFIAVNFYMVL